MVGKESTHSLRSSLRFDIGRVIGLVAVTFTVTVTTTSHHRYSHEVWGWGVDREVGGRKNFEGGEAVGGEWFRGG